MGTKNEVDTLLRLGIQYLNPAYREDAPGGLQAQKDQEEGLFEQVVAALATTDPRVLELWHLIKESRNGQK